MNEKILETYFEIEAGTLPYRVHDGRIEYLLIFRQKLNDYTFPKGHVEEGESLEAAALRETKEEAGVSAILEETIDAFEYKVLEKRKDGTQCYVLRRVYNYLAQVTEEFSGFSNPDQVEGHTSTQWCSYEDAYEKLSYENVRNVLKQGNEILKKREL